jgi:hypothetical protein
MTASCALPFELFETHNCCCDKPNREPKATKKKRQQQMQDVIYLGFRADMNRRLPTPRAASNLLNLLHSHFVFTQ